GVAYTPISTGQYNSFSGKFEGNGHTISNLNITDETGSCVGVFGYNTGLIRNLGVINANISGSGVAGGLCAYNDGTILNCYFTGTVSSIGTYVGGLCGQNRTGKIGNCYFNGSVSLSNTTSSYRYLGGLCGYNSNGNIWNCYCVATVSGEAEYKGAFAGDGSNNPPIYVGNCYYDNSVCSLPGLGRFDFGGVVTGKNFSSFAMGEVAFLLSQDTTIDGTVYEASNWGQVLTGDNRQDYPVLNGADVYKVTVTAACKENTGYMYSNTNEPIVSDHCYSCAKKTADATCTIPEQWSRYCSLCLEVSSNTEDTIPFGEPLGHCDILKHDANAPTCTEDGNPEYWTCSREDGVYYKDESLSETYNIDDIVLAATGHADNDDDGVCDNCPEVLNAYKHLQTLITSVKAIRPGDYSDASYQALQTALAEVEVLTDASTDEELATAYEILAAAKDGLKTIKTIVTTSCVPSNLSDLTGDGKYAVGETITLTAKAVSGYKFIGWYVAGSDTALSTDITYEVTVTEETAAELNYMAKYEANESKKMSVTVGNGTVAYRYQNGAESGIWSNSFTDNTFTEGTYFTVIAQPDAGHTFLYWIDSEGRILTESETYSFYLGDDLKLEARYKKAVDNKHYVIFKDMNGKILWTGDVSMNQSDDDWATSYGTVALPSHGMFTGYTFSRWSDASGNVISTDETGNIKITEDIVIRAEYVPKAGLTLTINGSLQDTTYAYASNVTVTADNSKDGKYFSGWYIGDNRVSDSLEYTFYITENTSLTAKYEGDDVIVQQPFVNMAISERTTLENGNQTMVMNVTWSVPEGYTFVEGGIVRSLKEEYSDKLTLTDVDGTNVKKNVSKIAVAEGTYVYTLTLGASSIGKNVYAVGYIICRNEATGEVLTIYTDRCTSNAVSGN
ncbi:MAG: InlB B-repeat-containing protein, partial [Lachnospiraceae bacterium]